MTDLDTNARRQAELDATRKVTIATGTASPLAWFLRLSWKVKFLLTAILMFSGYAAFIGVFESADPDRTCPPSMPREQRAACMIALENAAAERERIQEAQRAAAQAKIEAEQQALENEKLRQRAITDAKPLKEAFDRRLMEILAGPMVGFVAGTQLAIELNNLLRKYLVATDHPLNMRLPHWKEAARTTPPDRVNPLRWREGQAALDKACRRRQSDTRVDWTRADLIPCAEAIKLWIDSQSLAYAESYVRGLVLGAAQTPPSP